MEIIFTKHAIRKREILRDLGWAIELDSVKESVRKPDFEGKTKTGEQFVLKIVDERHSLKVVYKVEGAIIKVITFHITRKGRYNPLKK